jgi:hypothetical protein
VFGVASVDASSTPIAIGTPLVVGPVPGQLVGTDATPTTGSTVAYALQSVASGKALIPVLIQSR